MGGREAWRLTQEGVGRASLSSDTNKLTPVTGQQSVRCCLHPFPAAPFPLLATAGRDIVVVVFMPHWSNL